MNFLNKLPWAAMAFGALIVGCNPGPSGSGSSTSSTVPGYTVTIEYDSTKQNLPALQSFVCGRLASVALPSVGNVEAWLMVGGRTNSPVDSLNGGLHDLQANYTSSTSFPARSFNQNFFVYLPATDGVYSAPVDSLVSWAGSDSLADMLQAGNIQYYQDGNSLYLCGGYKVADTATNHYTGVTYDYLMVLDLDSVMYKVVAENNNPALANSIEQNSAATSSPDPYLRVTGGELKKLDNGNFYLVVGQCFGSNCPGGQQYTDEVRPFSITRTGTTLSITKQAVITDGLPDSTTQFRRRDLPVLPALDSSGNAAIAIYGGVFRCSGSPSACRYLWLNPLFISETSYEAVDTNQFKQPSNYYATSYIVIYDGSDTLYNTLIGGIGAGTSDDAFTNDVITMARSTSGGLPVVSNQASIGTTNYYGAESATILTDDNLKYNGSDILDGTQFNDSTETVVGYFIGGIEAFNSSPGTYGPGNSGASNKAFKIKVKRKS